MMMMRHFSNKLHLLETFFYKMTAIFLGTNTNMVYNKYSQSIISHHQRCKRLFSNFSSFFFHFLTDRKINATIISLFKYN